MTTKEAERSSRIEGTRAEHGDVYQFTLLDAIFDKPVFTSSVLLEKTGIQRNTLMTLLRQLKEVGILRTLQEGSGRRPATMTFPEIINIVEGQDLF